MFPSRPGGERQPLSFGTERQIFFSSYHAVSTKRSPISLLCLVPLAQRAWIFWQQPLLIEITLGNPADNSKVRTGRQRANMRHGTLPLRHHAQHLRSFHPTPGKGGRYALAVQTAPLFAEGKALSCVQWSGVSEMLMPLYKDEKSCQGCLVHL